MDASRRTMHGLTIIAFCIDVAISSQKIVSFKFPCNAAFCELSVVHYEIQSQWGRMLKWNSSVPNHALYCSCVNRKVVMVFADL